MFLRILKLARIFEKIAQYNPKEIEALSKRNPYPFSAWFGPNGRTYIPFSISNEQIQESSSKKHITEELSERGWIITDYVGGYATKNGRTVKIGKLLQVIQKEYLQEHEAEIKKLISENTEQYQKDLLLQKQKEEISWINELIKDFMTDPVRKTKKSEEKSIVFSQNPQDVATMSTGRGWTSCMNLEGGGNRASVLYEVEMGGFVAYLINSNDLEIKHPYARVHIRRFMDEKGNNIAFPEETVYGDNVPGFLEAVQKWVKEKQGPIQPGRYSLMGGEWSDTFDKRQAFVEEGTQTIPQLLETIQSEEISGAKYTVYQVEDKLEDMFFDDGVSLNRGFLSYEEAVRYKNSLEMNNRVQLQNEEIAYILQNDNMSEEEINNKINNRFYIRSYNMDETDSIKIQAVQKLIQMPDLTPEQVKMVANYINKNIGENSPLLQTLIKNYPNNFSDKKIIQLDLKDVLESMKNMPPEKAEAYTKLLLSQAMEKIEHITDHLPLKESTDNKPDYEVISAFDKILNYIREFATKLYEPEIQKLSNVPEKLKNKINNVTLNYIIRDISNIFSIKDADTPTVQQFYRKYLPKLEEIHNVRDVSDILYKIKSLKENGKEYIPAIKEKIEQIKSMYNQAKDVDRLLFAKTLSSLLHTLCTLDPSYGNPKKYKFYW